MASPAGSGPPAKPCVSAEIILRLSGLRKRYGDVVALDGVDLDVGRGEFFTLLGPSGSGKTTTLRLIGGFERPDAGTITLDGVDVARVPPFDRDINTVFQDYALFPHMSVAQNVAYGLEAKGVGAAERRRRVEEVLGAVQLSALAARRPAQLSGGQRQRVALARAIVNRPRLLLLDEPLGALDLKLRHAMQRELKQIQTQAGITFLYVTHDQEEALSMSTRLAVFNHGRIEQVGTPREIYERPATAFVAGFVGTSSLIAREGRTLVLRPENVRLARPGQIEPKPGIHVEAGRIEDILYLGMFTRYRIGLADGALVEAARPNLDGGAGLPDPLRGEEVEVAWAMDAARVLDDTP